LHELIVIVEKERVRGVDLGAAGCALSCGGGTGEELGTRFLARRLIVSVVKKSGLVVGIKIGVAFELGFFVVVVTLKEVSMWRVGGIRDWDSLRPHHPCDRHYCLEYR
jgi:hypothetical protein